MSAYSHPRLKVKELTEAEDIKQEYEYSLLDTWVPVWEISPAKQYLHAL